MAFPSGPVFAVAFDLDGLMFNTEEVFFECGVRLLARRQLQFTRQISHQIMGRRGDEAFVELTRLLGLNETPAELHRESDAILAELLKTRLEPMPGLFQLLDLLETREIPKAVCTSSSRPYMTEILMRFDLYDRFRFMLTAEDVQQGKPQPEIYLTAAARFGVSPQEMLVLEDSEAGSRAGHAAGAVVVSVPHEYSRDQDFSMADYVAGGLDDETLIAWLQR